MLLPDVTTPAAQGPAAGARLVRPSGFYFRGALSTKTAQHAKDLLMQKAYITPNVQAISFLLLADA